MDEPGRAGRCDVRNQTLSILHIEDDPLWGEAVKRVVEALPGPVDYRWGATAAEGIRLAREQEAEIVLLDLRLPDADGFGLAEELGRRPGRTRIIVLSARKDDAALLEIMRRPHLAGLIWKAGDMRTHLPVAIEEVRGGRRYYQPEVREALRRLRADPRAFFKLLSDREMALLPGLGRGLTDAEIAAQAGLSALTVKSHRQHIMAKLGLHRTPDLIYWAIEHGFVEPAGRSGRGSAQP